MERKCSHSERLFGNASVATYICQGPATKFYLRSSAEPDWPTGPRVSWNVYVAYNEQRAVRRLATVSRGPLSLLRVFARGCASYVCDMIVLTKVNYNFLSPTRYITDKETGSLSGQGIDGEPGLSSAVRLLQGPRIYFSHIPSL
ncbi:hypothetical protein PMIN03_012892 [Paraphaeosphaeria minitans]